MTSQSGDGNAFAGLRSKVSVAVQGKTTGPGIAAVEAAMRRLDPDATVFAAPPEPFIDVTTTASTADVLEAIQSCGFIAAPAAAGRPVLRGRNIFAVLGAALGAALLGAILIPILTLLGMLLLTAFDPVCGTPGDSGGCAMGVASIVLGAVPVGAGLGLLFGIYRGLR